MASTKKNAQKVAGIVAEAKRDDGLTLTQVTHIDTAAAVLVVSDRNTKTSRAEAARQLKLAGIAGPLQAAIEADFKLRYVAAYIHPGANKLTPEMLQTARDGMAMFGINAKQGPNKSQAQHDGENAARQALFAIRKLCGITSLTPKADKAPKPASNKPEADKAPRSPNVIPASPECRSFDDVVQHCLSQAQAMDGMARKAATKGVPLTASFATALAAFKKAMRIEAASLETNDDE